MSETGAMFDRRSGRCRFSVWAPLRDGVELRITSPDERTIPLKKDADGYWSADVDGVAPGTRYLYRLDGDRERPDPASRYQPEGVHGPSEIIDHSAFRWNDDAWAGIALPEYILYELHAGTFTPEGAFDAIIPRLPYLKELGVTAIELMPVAQFPGSRNWGYDGVYPCAVQNSYGGPEGLKRLVNACHEHGLAVVLDFVCNHLGPEGNYLWDYGPYFTDRYTTPWGDAINFDGPYSDEVRSFFIESALAWVTDYHIDALRIDAIHGIFDFSAKHFLRELGEAVHARAGELGREIHVIPESDLNDVRVINPVEKGGYGLDAQWNDDFHHALHTLITGERRGYYEDFGKLEHLETAFREGFVYSGQYSAYRKRRHGNSSKERPASRFVVFSQNHDQTGNRLQGERLSSLVGFEQLKLAAGAVLLSPFIPLLFMGEEYGETAPFRYFVSHGDQALIDAVRRGRAGEFKAFGWEGAVPDPQAEETFRRSIIDPDRCRHGNHPVLAEFYRTLIRLRKELAPLRHLGKEDMNVESSGAEKTLFVRRWNGNDEVFCLFHFGDEPRSVALPLEEGRWERVLDSSDARWNGPGSASPPSLTPGAAGSAVRVGPHGVVLYRRAGGGR